MGEPSGLSGGPGTPAAPGTCHFTSVELSRGRGFVLGFVLCFTAKELKIKGKDEKKIPTFYFKLLSSKNNKSFKEIF